MAIYCNKCGARHECSVCPVCAGFGLSNLQVAAGVGKSFQPTDELRAKFEAWSAPKGSNFMHTADGDDYWDSWTSNAWGAWQAAYASRDAEVEALRRKAFALDALVAAGFISEEKLAESLSIADTAMAKESERRG